MFVCQRCRVLRWDLAPAPTSKTQHRTLTPPNAASGRQAASHLLHAAGALSRQKGRASGQSRDVCAPACRWAAHDTQQKPCHAASSVPHSPRHQMPPQGASHLLRARVPRIVRFRWPLPGSVPSLRSTRRTGRRAKSTLRGPRHRRGPVARSTWPRRRRTNSDGPETRSFELERRPFVLAIKAAASAGGRLR